MNKKKLTIILTPFLLFIIALAINLFLIKGRHCIEVDGVAYANQGIRFFKGLGFYGIYPPVYPLLIGLLNLILDNAELSARLISVFFGSLTMFPLFFMARWAFGHRVAMLTCVLALIYPNLSEYTPAALSESTYLFFFLLGLVISWITLTHNKKYLYILSGFIWGIAFLTRPEGQGYFVLYILILLVKFFLERKKVYFIYIILLIIGFFIASFPYLFNQKKQTGRWSFGNKTGLNFVLGEGVGIQQDWGTSFEKTYFSLSDDGSKLSYELMLEQDAGTASYVLSHPKELVRRYIINLHLMNKYVIPGIFYPAILMLFTVGLLLGPINETKRASVLFLPCIPYLAFPLFIVAPRYFIYFVPIILIWSARGIVEFAKWIAQLIEGMPYKKLKIFQSRKLLEIAIVSFVTITFIPFTFRPFLRGETQKKIYKQIGIWMKDNLPSNSKVIARKPWIPFYAEMEPVGFPYTPWNRILEFAQKRKVSYIVADQNIIGGRKELAFLFEETFNPEAVIRIREFTDSLKKKIYIYEVVQGR